MWEKIRVIFTIPELRQKILLTLVFLAIYRVGWWIPLLIVDPDKMSEFFHAQANSGLGKCPGLKVRNVQRATQLSQATIFGLGIMPYISASIIFQLLGSVWKPLEELQKEGETGRKKISPNTPAVCHRYSVHLVPKLVLRLVPGQKRAGAARVPAINGGLPFPVVVPGQRASR